MTLDVIVDRVRSLCVSSPFDYQEAARLDRFEWDPSFGDVSPFRVETVSQVPRGGSGFTEERTDLLVLTVGRAINDDYDGCRRVLTRAAHSLTSAIVRDGAEDSGSYTVPDAGTTWRLEPDPTQAYLSLRLTLPVNYMVGL